MQSPPHANESWRMMSGGGGGAGVKVDKDESCLLGLNDEMRRIWDVLVVNTIHYRDDNQTCNK